MIQETLRNLKILLSNYSENELQLLKSILGDYVPYYSYPFELDVHEVKFRFDAMDALYLEETLEKSMEDIPLLINDVSRHRAAHWRLSVGG